MHQRKYTVLAGASSLSALTSLAGCSSALLFHPQGPVGESIRFVIITAIALMLIVVIPVFIMAFWFPRQYREANPASTYTPKWSSSGKIELVMWAVPVVIVTVLSILAWSRTHALDPYKPIPSAARPINIDVVSLDWKWLFIYPDENIAAVNQIAFPARVPVSFRLTSETVMTSFFIPQLGSQIYAMAGMQTRLHLLADQPGTYSGHNQQFSGPGYASMFFKAYALSPEEFQAWVQKVRQSPEKLDLERYEKLARPSTGYPVTYFSAVQPGLFVDIMRRFDPGWGKEMGHMGPGAPSAHPGTGHGEEH
jgi:cytochrome o ubiquinol oxidase subunit II